MRARWFVWVAAALVAACTGASEPLERPAGERPRADARPGCEAQVCGSDDGGCDAVVLEGVWMWNGAACVEAYASGCGRRGSDCDALYANRAACERARADCLR